jgi:ribose transport system substrate-binding protein
MTVLQHSTTIHIDAPQNPRYNQAQRRKPPFNSQEGAVKTPFSNKFAFAAATLGVFSLLAAGCNNNSGGTPTASGSPAPGGGAPAASGKKLKLAFITNNASDFWTIAHKGTDKADKELDNVEVEFQIPADGTAAEQKRIVDDLLAKGIDGFAISPKDPANQTQMLNDAAKQAIVVTQDSDAPTSDRTAYVGTDNVAAGKQAGEMIKEALPNGGKIMLFVGSADAQNAKDRADGIKEALKGSKVEIIDTRTDEADRVKAKANVADTLVKYPDIAGLVGLWSYNGPAIRNAVKDANKIGKVKIICFDEEDETLDGVKNGDIYATVVQQPFEFGYQSIMLLAKVAGGDKSAIPADKKQIVPTLILKKADVEAFATKLKELRGK